MATRGAVAFGALATAGVYGLTRIINTTRESMDSMLMLSQQLGTTTEDVQVLTRAAELDGVSVESMTANLKKMTKGLGEASLGAGAAKGALDALGLDAQALIQLPLSEQFGAIADKISGLSTQAEKAAMATQIFGRSGVDMLVMLDRGSAVIGNMKDEMGRTGELFSTEDAMKVEAMGDAIVNLTGVYNAFAQNLTIQLAPGITYVIELMQQWVESIGGAEPIIGRLIDIASVMFDNWVNYLGFLADRFAGVFSIIDDITMAVAVMGDANVKVWGLLDTGTQRYINSIVSIGGAYNMLKGTILLLAHTVSAVFSIVVQTVTTALTFALEGLAKIINSVVIAIDKALHVASKLAQFAGAPIGDIGIGSVRGITEELSKGATRERQEAVAELKSLFTVGNAGGAFSQSLLTDAEDAFKAIGQQANEITPSESLIDWYNSMKVGMSEAYEAADNAANQQAKVMGDAVLPDKEKELSLQKDITGEMEKQAKKDTGQGTAMRAGEFAQNVGRVFGGTGATATGGTANASPTSFAARSAMAAGDARTGADASIPLLQGILDASKQIVTNTMRPAVAVAG
jgi:hypothetical protein